MAAPQVAKLGARTLWINFSDHCKQMNRDYKHALSFILAELGTDGSFDRNNQLVIKGKFLSKKLESLLRKYISA